MKRILLIFIALFLADSVRAAPPDQPLIYQENLVYQGAFLLPTGTVGTSSFNYMQGRPVYRSAGPSLYMGGHTAQSEVAEVSIPTAINNPSLAALNRATTLQTFADFSEGLRAGVPGGGSGVYLGGLLISGGNLFASYYAYYDASNQQILSHVKGNLTLSTTGETTTMYQIGSYTFGGNQRAGYVSGYMGTIPAEWATGSYFNKPAMTGQAGIPIISRTSYGPSLHAFDPADVGVTAPVPVNTMLYYTTANNAARTGTGYDVTSTTYNGGSRVAGVVFPTGTASVLFFGRHGEGTWCYGATPSPCVDPETTGSGTHSYPYYNKVWAYNANDLLAVKNGTKQPYEPNPYAMWNISFPYSSPETGIVGAAYDDAARIYLLQYRGDTDRAVVHVYDVSVGALAPVAPTKCH